MYARTARVLVLLAAGLLLAACASERLHREGLGDVEAGDYERGISKLETAARENPGNLTYRLDLQSRREQAVQQLIAAADRARKSGALEEAERTYKRILAFEPGNSRAQRGLEGLETDRRHAELVARAKREFEQGRLEEADARLGAVLQENPGAAAANALRARIETARGPKSVTPRLRTRDNRPVTLQFRDAPTKMVFEVLSRQTGINFIFDKDVKSDGKTTIFVQQVPIEQAIDLVLGQNQLARQVLSDNMVLVYPNVAAKQKEYQDQIVRTFYLTNAEPKRVMEMMKTMLNAKTLFVDERSNTLVMRDTPEAIRMAERLLASVDVAEPEVMMEVEVLEISRNRLSQLGIRYPDNVTLTPTPLAGDPLVLADFKGQDETTIAVSDVTLGIDLKKEAGISNLLASPRIRARNREKAKILIGQRVPVITNSVTPTTNGGSVVTGNVQYVDVGLTLEVEPTVYLDNDVGIKVNLEVSNIIREISNSTSGTLAYQIGTRNATTMLRLRDGETQVLAGLIQDEDRRTSNHVPGVGDIPLLGRLFGTRKDTADKSEIVLSITPRIIRAQPRPSSDNTEFWYGTDTTLRSAPLAAQGAAGGGANAAPAPAATGTVAAPAEGGNGAPDEGTADSDAPPGPQSRPTLTLDGPGQVSVGQDFQVTLRLGTPRGLASTRSVLRFDPAVLELQSADAGAIVPDAARAGAMPRIEQRNGRALQDVVGGEVSGEGELMVLRFKALSPRPSTLIALQQFAALGEDGKALPVMAPRPLVVVVAP